MNNFRHQIPVYCNTAIKLIKLPPSMTPMTTMSCITAASFGAYETKLSRHWRLEHDSIYSRND